MLDWPGISPDLNSIQDFVINNKICVYKNSIAPAWPS